MSVTKSDLSVTKSELIERVCNRQKQLSIKDVESAVKSILEQMAESLEHGRRIEIRGFGSFSLHYREARTGRNPKTGESVMLDAKYVPHFKPGKDLRDRVNEALLRQLGKLPDSVRHEPSGLQHRPKDASSGEESAA